MCQKLLIRHGFAVPPSLTREGLGADTFLRIVIFQANPEGLSFSDIREEEYIKHETTIVFRLTASPTNKTATARHNALRRPPKPSLVREGGPR